MKTSELNEKQNEIIEKVKFNYPDLIKVNGEEIEVNTSAKSIQYHLNRYLSNLHVLLHEKYDDSRIRWNLDTMFTNPSCRGLLCSVFLHLNICDFNLSKDKYVYPIYEFIMEFATDSQSIWIDEGDRMSFILCLS